MHIQWELEHFQLKALNPRRSLFQLVSISPRQTITIIGMTTLRSWDTSGKSWILPPKSGEESIRPSMPWSTSWKTVPHGASRRLRTRCIRSAHFKISISLRTGRTEDRAWGTSLALSVSSSRTTRSFSRKGNSLGRQERSSLAESLPTPQMGSRLWGQRRLLGLQVASMGGSVAKIWISLGITTLISSVLRMIHMSLRITTSKLLPLLRHNQRAAAQLQQHLQKQSINHSLRKREQRKNLRQTLPLIHLPPMKKAIRRKRRRLQLRLA